MAQKRDYYEVLGVGKNADEAELKKVLILIQMPIAVVKSSGDVQVKHLAGALERCCVLLIAVARR